MGFKSPFFKCQQNDRLTNTIPTLGFDLVRSATDPLLPVTTVSLGVAQFIARQKPFVAFGGVPNAVVDE